MVRAGSIPRPAYCSRLSLQRAMRLGDDYIAFKKFTKHMRKVIDDVLDTSMRYSDQDADAVDNYLRVAVTSYPPLMKYDDAWPATIYAQKRLREIRTFTPQKRVGWLNEWLNDRYEGEGTAQRLTEDMSGMQRIVKLEAVEEEEEWAGFADAISEGPSEPAASPTVPEPSPFIAFSLSPASTPTFVSRMSSSPTSSPVAEGTGASPLHVAAPPTRIASTSLSALLASRVPDLPDLPAKLAAAGVATHAELRSFRSLPERQRLAFLRDDVQLSPLQSMHVDTVLGEWAMRGALG
ncbi:hypothetical protein OBBRIDRAFT_892075 [Obba rivulosa]|uniref:Uncharacterized protein n=1 Tax=Obba rivulosa TaxID=1052685 RepID=A0A8E2ALA4_9APHY|nr:hypothetical protein OBBRIDRAFT_892075 [Obba rivulosa]